MPYLAGSSFAFAAHSSQQTVISRPPTFTFRPPSFMSQSHTGHFSKLMASPVAESCATATMAPGGSRASKVGRGAGLDFQIPAQFAEAPGGALAQL